ncbi:hypothetical protein DUNSADRAFT_3208 [Dunaliella salina]|uniref:Encoded protein n=1 Tax=Dunaliella salina TaxID=3046 RepID=A0ABQ7GUH6_DUNSA|nr:hypothetical protein DUNSADRAFT_3208 [Dunaliella salina]|eukprot:KAF5838228.1 hypothetical protein DUNSADRAFT_3208 [Dunaliella salina]
MVCPNTVLATSLSQPISHASKPHSFYYASSKISRYSLAAVDRSGRLLLLCKHSKPSLWLIDTSVKLSKVKFVTTPYII